MKQSTVTSGRIAEERALAYLQQQGLQLVARNARSRGGEIDLVMRDGSVLVFIEVRQRSSARFGGAAASINAAKRARLWRTAQVFLQRCAPLPPCRFDAVCIDGTALTWLRHIVIA
jgi:putative endonuclease